MWGGVSQLRTPAQACRTLMLIAFWSWLNVKPLKLRVGYKLQVSQYLQKSIVNTQKEPRRWITNSPTLVRTMKSENSRD